MRWIWVIEKFRNARTLDSFIAFMLMCHFHIRYLILTLTHSIKSNHTTHQYIHVYCDSMKLSILSTILSLTFFLLSIPWFNSNLFTVFLTEFPTDRIIYESYYSYWLTALNAHAIWIQIEFPWTKRMSMPVLKILLIAKSKFWICTWI